MGLRILITAPFSRSEGLTILYRKRLLLALLLLIASTLVHTAHGQPYSEPVELSFEVYPDGYVAVEYLVDVDPSRSRVNVSLFGELHLDLLVEDQDGLILDSSPIEGGLTVDTLGSVSVTISYSTPDLTDKAGQIWRFGVSTPIAPTIVLPEGSTIVSLSSVPLAMSSLNGGLVIAMPGGEIEVAYTMGIEDASERAQAAIDDAEEFIGEINAEGVITTEADSLIQQANAALEAGQHAEAENLAADAEASAQITKEQASQASAEISVASEAIIVAEGLGNTVGLDIAPCMLDRANDAFDEGNYLQATALAEEAQDAATDAEMETEPGFPWFWVGGLVVLGAAAVSIFVFLRKRPGKAVETAERFDMGRLFDEHPHLRLDDKEVLRFLAESGGGVFAAELRERFGVPRTSLWRMIRRLEREGAVEVERIGGQSLVKLHGRYRSGGPGA